MYTLAIHNMYTGTLRLPWLRFFRAFPSVVRQMPGYTSQRRGTVRTVPKLVVICVVLLLFVLFYVLFVCKCVLYYCHRVLTQLQLRNISYHIIIYHIIYHIISYHIISCHVMSCHVMSCHIISYHIISYHIISYHIISYHIISYLIISCHIKSTQFNQLSKAMNEVESWVVDIYPNSHRLIN